MKKIHVWLSIPAGIIITLMCLTGAIMVFQEEILHTVAPARYNVKATVAEPLSLDEVVTYADAALVNDTVTAIQILNDPLRTYVATLASGPRSHAYINPYTGEITGYYNYRKGFFSNVLRLHRWLMFKNTQAGKLITGISTICFVMVLISGIAVWWPRKHRFKKSFFKVKWRGSISRRLFDMHRIWGVYAATVLLLLSLTGLMWSFGWYRNGVATLFRIENKTGAQGHNRQGNTARTHAQRTDWWQRMWDAAQKEVPSYQSIRIAKNGTVTVLPHKAAHPRATDTYRFSPGTNTLELVSKYGDTRNSSYMMTWAYALHTGSWGGFWSKLLVFLASLVGASLPVTGYMLWIKGRKRKYMHHRKVS